MPELPEVETARRNTRLALVGRRITAIHVRLPKILRDSPIPDLDVLIGARLERARRRAKILILDFNTGLSLLIHFKLSGQWAIMRPDGSRLVAGHPVPDPAGPLPHRVTHATFSFDDATISHFSDVRQFGWMRLMPTENLESVLATFAFGPEGTGELDIPSLEVAFGKRTIPVKTLLLDQSFVAGLGNIYADEVLFQARVHPAQPSNSVSTIKRRRIIDAIPRVLEAGIAQGGAKIIHNRAFPIDELPAVHGREGEPCFRCRTIIRKIRVGSRGTYYCPRCQALARQRTPAPENHPVQV